MLWTIFHQIKEKDDNKFYGTKNDVEHTTFGSIYTFQAYLSRKKNMREKKKLVLVLDIFKALGLLNYPRIAYQQVATINSNFRFSFPC